jgi:hypothetical protein
MHGRSAKVPGPEPKLPLPAQIERCSLWPFSADEANRLETTSDVPHMAVAVVDVDVVVVVVVVVVLV